jgi:ABC-2 type transport system ATP-binding protein
VGNHGARTPVIAVEQLTKVYEPSPIWLRFLLRTAITSPVTALDGISFQVTAGQICAVVGPNGAGKSTLFRVLSGLTTPTAGTATVMGRDVTTESLAVRRTIGFMPAGDQTIYLRLSCRENLRFHGRLQGMGDRDLDRSISETLALVGLSEAADWVGFALSAGMRARLMLARALLHRPQVLILDEPTGAVDPVGSFDLLQTIQRVAAESGVTVLLSSHRLEEIEALHDQVLLLDRGQCLHFGDLRSLRRVTEIPRIELSFEAGDLAASAAATLSAVQAVQILEVGDRHVTVSTDIGTGRLLESLNGQLVGLCSVREVTLPLRDLLAKIFATPAGSQIRGPRWK